MDDAFFPLRSLLFSEVDMCSLPFMRFPCLRAFLACSCRSSFIRPATPQSVLPAADQRVDVRGVCSLRRSCDGNRRTPLTGESERVLEQLGHSTKVMPRATSGVLARDRVHHPQSGILFHIGTGVP